MSYGNEMSEEEKGVKKKKKEEYRRAQSLENCPLWGPMFVNDVGLNARVQGPA